ncbi:hypothetical protein GW17_00032813 [Ensete ventricosum]|nr:hypothetical protein GW17_00032813 [Ensete ventricosum]
MVVKISFRTRNPPRRDTIFLSIEVYPHAQVWCRRCRCLGLLFERVVEALEGDSMAAIWSFEGAFRVNVG